MVHGDGVIVVIAVRSSGGKLGCDVSVRQLTGRLKSAVSELGR